MAGRCGELAAALKPLLVLYLWALGCGGIAAGVVKCLGGARDRAHPSSAGPSCSLKYSSTGTPFNETEMEQIRAHFLANIDIDGSGAVVAAPDHNTGPDGDYYFHWERDGALTMDAVMHTISDEAEVEAKMQHYVRWVTKTQSQPAARDGVDVRTEPKYTIPDGKPFMGGWCRPQNDGPGLRGRSLAEHGLALLNSKTAGSEAVKQALWTGDEAVLHGGLVKYDLDWVAENWQSNGCDLWEEIQSADFFWNRFVDRASLDKGALLAEKMGDAASAAKYRAARDAINATLMSHYQNGFVFEASNRQRDSSVIEAFNVGYLDDGVFHPLSEMVLGTVVVLNDLFCNAYAINGKDGAAGLPGILYGRYEGDHYDGGNPWTLLTASLAQLVYRQATAAVKAGQVEPAVYAQLQEAYSIDAGLSGKRLGDALLGVGDGILLRMKHHAAAGLHLNEQINRDDGSMTSAKDLTWTYANVLKAMKARSDYLAESTSNWSHVIV